MSESGATAKSVDITDRVASIGASKWWTIAYGVLSLIAGLAALSWPGATLLTLAVVFSVQLFVLGVFRIVAAFAVPDASTGTKVLAIVVGILSVIVGVICLRSPLQTIVVLTLVLGAFWLANGIVEIVTGISGRGEKGRGWAIVAGLIGVIGGIIVLSAPVTSAVSLAWVLGILLVAHGIVAIISGFTREKATAPASAAPAPTARPTAAHTA
ncbi:HdeD family acid-resistance protein [Actinomycetospora corticicola]|uniref:Uncharacterized membrane protein HdeD (DUF308 family) n=1 Tax=Actinomycetospora corticicola TaxID=663602 RepID=A0A7Y9DVE6_9PSEU|nr:HdeD family acid-resistance protein [Actinomycetospora corticicola]NYD36150.1 uncharacterized membrane protein HdeD (DUF308 family) [Actinomycetospora corticicola]